MSKKIYYSALFFLLGIKIMPIVAQGGGCGTYVNAAQIALESSVSTTDGNPTQSLPQVNRTLSITVFVVKDQLGNAGISEASIQAAVSTLNQYFSPIGLAFRICLPFHYVDNYNFNNLYATNNEKDLVTLNFERNTINLYLVNTLYDQNTDVNGYTYMPGSAGKNSIFLNKGSIGGSTLAHQIGHFFNLYHTHEAVAFGSEKVTRGAGANCSTAGDRCCDTDADPNLNLNGVSRVNSNCIYTGTFKDSNNELYYPSAKNIMSFSNDNCRCFFSRTQYLRMIYALNHFRNNLR